MKNILTVIAIVGLNSIGISQFNYNFNNDVETTFCKYSGKDEGYYSSTWDIYYTKNNQIDGEIDSLNSCFAMQKAGNFGFVFKLSQFDKSRPLFIKYDVAKSEKIYLAANSVYGTRIELYSNKNGVFIKSSECNENCGKIFINRKEYYGDSLAVKHFQKFANSFSGNEYTTSEICNSTNKVDSTILTELKFSVKFDESFTEDVDIRFGGASVYQLWELNEINKSQYFLDRPIEDSIMRIEPGDLSGRYFGSNIVLHTLPGYQSDKNIDKKLLTLKNNVNYPVKIQIKIQEYNNLFFQEFTTLTPDKVLGIDSLFHKLELILDGGEICINFIDVLIDNHVNFRYKSGDLFISGNSGCMSFRKESKLIVDPHANLDYGYHGNGMLAVNGSTIEVMDYGTLLMNGTVVLLGGNDSQINLFPNSKLIFGKGSSIKSLKELNEKINVYGYPWQVDMSNLDIHSISRINIISPSKENEIIIYPNPASDKIFINTSKYFNQEYFIFNIKSEMLQKGIIGDHGISIDQLPNDLYFIKIGSNIQKFVIAN